MIKQEHTYQEARCDACGADMLDHTSTAPDINAHYATLRPCFGYGSPLDSIEQWVVLGAKQEYEICGSCWEKALSAIKLPVHLSEYKPKGT